MNLTVELEETKQKVLIVDAHNTFLKEKLKKQLKHFGLEVFFSSHLPKSIHGFDYCFCINSEKAISFKKQKL
jgi:hypothetical protein